jgi:hypothetical protein
MPVNSNFRLQKKRTFMQSFPFAVNDEPFCLWEVEPEKRVRSFLDGIDVDFFAYTLQTHLDTEDENRALVAIRLSLHHATEAMFSLLGAFVQAPRCPYAWIAKCSNKELRAFTARVSRSDPHLISKLNIPVVNWHSVGAAVFATYQPGTERQENTVKCFADLWVRLTGELNNQTYVEEYNALKHGFRIRPGGFTLAVGVEHEYGVPPPASELEAIGHSAFGASFFKIEPLGFVKGNRHIRSRQTSVNWSLERTILLHQLVNMSINNVVSALKVVNHYKPNECKFLRPENDSDFSQPWMHNTGVISMSSDHELDESRLPRLSRTELLAMLRAK